MSAEELAAARQAGQLIGITDQSLWWKLSIIITCGGVEIDRRRSQPEDASLPTLGPPDPMNIGPPSPVRRADDRDI